MKAYKGFNKDMTCRGFQFEEGKEYEHTGKIKVCENGFHACEHPLDVFSYYAPSKSIYHEVDLDGHIDKDSNDTKVSASKIKIGASINIAGIVKAAIEYTKANINKTEKSNSDCGASSATGYYGASSATGYYGASSATGYCGASSATGDYGASSATGNYGASSATGDYGASSATGYKGASSATGDCGASSATGDCGASSATGNYGASSATGYKGASSATGDYGASSATGYCGASSATGYCGASSCDNPESISIAWGYKSKAKGCLGSHIVLSEWEYDGEENPENECFKYRNDKDYWHLKNVKLFKVDGVTIKPDTYYELVDGKPINRT